MNSQKDPRVIFEDDCLIVYNKPTGLVVNKSVSQKGITLQDSLLKKIDIKKYPDDSEFVSRIGLVHRLDKDTSGIVLVAKDPETFKNLQLQFKNRTVKKEYLGVVMGELKQDKIEIDAPIGRNPKNRFKFAITKDGKSAKTLVEKLQEVTIQGSKYTLVKLYPVTGRTHQIRVHMTGLSTPIAGDKIYAGKKRFSISNKVFGRLMLHANKISFNHPTNNDLINIESDVPDEFSSYFKL